MDVMEDNKIRNLAKKILHAKTFQELHDIIMAYASDELEFVEFPDSFKFIPTGGKQEHEHETWPEKFPTGIPEGDNESLKKFREMYNDSEKKSFKDLDDLFFNKNNQAIGQ